MQDSIDNIKKIKKFLADSQQEAQASLDDPQAAQWKKVDFLNIEEMLFLLGIDLSLNADNNKYRHNALEIIKKTEIIKNELGNIEADIRMHTTNPRRVKNNVQKVVQKSRELEPLLAEMFRLKTKIHQATATIKDNLSLHTLIRLARKRLSKHNSEPFENGYKYYLTLSGDKDKTTGKVSLEKNFQTAVAIEKKLTDLELPELPAIVENIIQHQIKICHEAATATKIFIDYSTDSFQPELEEIKKFKEDLDVVRQKNIFEIIGETEKLADDLSKLLRAFFFKSFIIKGLDTVELLLQNLKQFLGNFDETLFNDLKDKIMQTDSPLNPAVPAGKTSVDFFSGITGLLRMIKLFWGGLSGQKTIDEVEFQKLLIKAISSCKLYYSDQKDALEKMRDYINGYLDEYSRPFPYNDLFAETQKAIYAYGGSVKQYIFTQMADHPGPVGNSVADDSDKETASTHPISLGRIIGKIEARAELLTRASQEWEKKSKKG